MVRTPKKQLTVKQRMEPIRASGREPLVAGRQHARLPKGFSKARRALVILLQLTPREAIPEAELRDYDRIRGALLDIIVEPFMRMLDNDPELSLVAHDHEG